MNNYNENSIITLSPREAIRQNIGMYIGDSDKRGMHQLMTEIVANAMDEAAAGFGNTIIVKVNSEDNELMVIDNGRGIPFRKNKEGNYAIIEMCTSLHSGGKFEGAGNYKSSLGLHGLGASLVQSLSSSFEITSIREDGSCVFSVLDGLYEDEPDIIGSVNEVTGSIVSFVPDKKIFGDLKWDRETIAKELQTHALLNNGINFKLIWDNELVNSFQYQNGIVDMLEIKRGNTKALSSPYYFKTTINANQPNEYTVEFAFQYIDKAGETIEAFTNGGYNPEYGTHVTGWKTAYTGYVNKTARKLQYLSDKDENFSGDTVRKGLLLVLSIKMCERPMFAQQTKYQLTSPGARTAVSQAVGKMEIPDKIFKTIIDKIQVEQKAELAAKRSKEAAAKVAKGGKSMNTLKDLPSKLADCERRDGELFLVEGDSAAGGAKETRNKKLQAVLPLKGKVLNTTAKDLADIIKSEVIKDLLTTLGCGIGENFNINNLRYDKIIIMADADPDGGHIACLLMTLFLHHLPELVKAGKIYCAVSPLYRVLNGKNYYYYYTPEELKKGKKGETIRIKGLGELDPRELYNTTMNPDNRKLIQMTTNDIESTLVLYNKLLGKSSSERRDFILSHKFEDVDDSFEEDFDDDAE